MAFKRSWVRIPLSPYFRRSCKLRKTQCFQRFAGLLFLRFPVQRTTPCTASIDAGDADPLSILHISLLSKKETHKRLFFSLYPHTNHRNRYPVITAVRVNGTEILIKALFETSYPFFFKMPIPVILAEAPTGVMLPPSVAPVSRPK